VVAGSEDFIGLYQPPKYTARHREERAESGVNVESGAAGISWFGVAAKARGGFKAISEARCGPLDSVASRAMTANRER